MYELWRENGGKWMLNKLNDNEDQGKKSDLLLYRLSLIVFRGRQNHLIFSVKLKQFFHILDDSSLSDYACFPPTCVFESMIWY